VVVERGVRRGSSRRVEGTEKGGREGGAS